MGLYFYDIICLNYSYLSRDILYNCLEIFIICPEPGTGRALIMFNIVYAKTHVQLNSHSIPKVKI